ncbi:hypothetical protein ABW20_dc0110328 [Dactylellina cionopaga]|nr:hypothetical protein ABW20_dc0110328 [Dactylellina cionopaga]
MKFFSSLFFSLSAATGVLAAPALSPDQSPNPLAKRNTPNSQGTNGGYFYQFWSDGIGSVTYANGANGQFSVNWNGNGDFTAGKGWNPGSNSKIINFYGTYSPGGCGSLAVYGWTTNALVEYYIMENYAGNPVQSSWTYKGTFSSDNSNYNVYYAYRSNAPSIIGSSNNFPQYISVRQTKRTSGTVTTANHFTKWAALGMPMGSSFNYQIMSVEAWCGAGSSTITIY